MSMLAALALAASPLLVAETSASAQVAPLAGGGLKLTAPSLFTATPGTWVPVRAKIKNTSAKAATVTLTVSPAVAPGLGAVRLRRQDRTGRREGGDPADREPTRVRPAPRLKAVIHEGKLRGHHG